MLRAALFLVVRQWRKHRWLYVATIASCALGVALVVSMDLAIESSKRAIDRLDAFEWGVATHRIVARGRALTDAEAFDWIAKGLGGSPVVRANLSSERLGSDVVPVLGVDPFTGRSLRGGETFEGRSFERWWNDPTALFASRALMDRYNILDGESLDVRIGGKPARVRMYESGQREGAWIVADIATVQELSGRVGFVDGLVLRVEAGEQAALEAKLPPALSLVTLKDTLSGRDEMTRSFRFNLFALSLLGLLVAGFLVFSATHFLVSERLPEFGLLGVLGWTSNGLFGLILLEAVLLGLIGAALGIPIGAALGHWTVFFVTRTLRDLFGQVHVAWADLSPSVVFTGAALSLVFAVVGAWIPALRLRRPSMLRAAESATDDRAGWHRRMVQACLAFGLGFVLMDRLAPPTVAMGFMTGLCLVGAFAAGVPGTLWGILVVLGRLASGWRAFLGARRGLQAVRITWFGTAALVVALGMTLAISQMVMSFRSTLTDWMRQVVRGDVYVSPDDVFSNADAFLLDPKVVEGVRTLAARGRVETLRTLNASTERGPIAVAALSKPLVMTDYVWWRPPVQADAPTLFANGAVLISEPLARRMGWEEASEIRYETPSGWVVAPVLGIFREYGNARGVMHLAHDRASSQWRDARVSAMEASFDGDQDRSNFVAALRAAPLARGLKIQTNREIFDQALLIFDQTFAVTRSLRWVSLVIAILGVLAAHGARIARGQEESRVFGLLGATRTDRKVLSGIEAFAHACAAAGLSVLLGNGLTWVLIHVIQVRAFGWSFPMQVSWESWSLTAVLAFVGTMLPMVAFQWERINAKEDRE